MICKITPSKAKYYKFTKDPRKIQDLKDQAFEMDDVDELINKSPVNFDKKSISLMNKEDSIKILRSINNIKVIQNNVEIKQNINDNIQGLACYLSRLKVSMLRRDKEVTSQIIKKFLQQKDMNLLFLMKEIGDFNSQIDDLKSHYHFLSELSKNSHLLEVSSLVDHDKAKSQIKDLYSINNKQRELLFHVGQNFLHITRELDSKLKKQLQKDKIL